MIFSDNNHYYSPRCNIVHVFAQRLEVEGIENARFEAIELLVCAGADRMTLYTDPTYELSTEVQRHAAELLARRVNGEPLQYIIGEWEFYGLPFKVGKGVLIPRQDTEMLVDVARRFLEERGKSERRTLDLCAGSGCIGISLAKTAGADTVCVEKFAEAFAYLEENITLNGVCVEAVLGDVFDENTVAGEFDLIVSNPPYLTEDDMQALQKEVRSEPQTALFGGKDGLDHYRKILEMYPKKLKRGGMLAVEIGIHQECSVCDIFRENALKPQTEKDLCGVYRVVYGIKQ